MLTHAGKVEPAWLLTFDPCIFGAKRSSAIAKFFLVALCFAAVAQASLLCDAVWSGTVEDVQKALQTEDVNQRDSGWTPLMWAAITNSTAKVQAILAKEPDVDLQDSDGWTALMFAAAARYGSAEMVEALLAAGAAVDLQTNAGATALQMAAKLGYVASTKALLRAGAAVDLADHSGRTPLFRAARWGNLATAELLLKKGARPEVAAKNGQTPLAVAVSRQQWCHDHHWTCPEIQPAVELLQKSTPTGLELLKARVMDPDSRKLLLATAAGIFVGSLWHLWHWKEIDKGRPIGPRKLATKAVAPSPKRHLAFRAAEVVACALLPLGVGMLWLEVWFMLPFYFIFYTVPRCVELGRGALDSPALLLAGLPRQNGCSIAKVARAMATAALLALTAWMPLHCGHEIGFAIFGNMMFRDTLHGFLSRAMAEGITPITPPLISTAASQFVCPEWNTMGFWLSRMFFRFLLLIWSVSFAWLVAVLLEMMGLLQAQRLTEADEELIQQLEAMLSSTTTAEEVSAIHLGSTTVKPEKAFTCNPFPGGIYFTVFMAVLDGVVMDFLSIFNLFKAGQFYFASCFTFIMTTSTVAELLTALRMDRVLDQPCESVARGMMTKPLAMLLQMEQVFESPFSFCLSCYSWVFAVRDWFSFGSGVFSLVLGVFSLADSIYWLEDANLHQAQAEKATYRVLLPVLESESKLSSGSGSGSGSGSDGFGSPRCC